MQAKNLKIPPGIPLEHIPGLWEQNDVLIFLVYLDDYGTLGPGYLDGAEKEQLERLQTGYFKKRYIVSRVVLKCILCRLFKERAVSDIALYKDEYGKIHVSGHEELHLCISYTENIAALAVSKVEVGVDIEFIKQRSLSKISKYLNTRSSNTISPNTISSHTIPHTTLSHTIPSHPGKAANEVDLLTAWTLNEAYCKFSNKSIFSTFRDEPELARLSCSSYVLDDKYILAIITDSERRAVNISSLQKISCL